MTQDTIFDCNGPGDRMKTCYCDGCVARRIWDDGGYTNVRVGDETISLVKLAELIQRFNQGWTST